MTTIPLRETVQALRAELMTLAEDASTQAVRFELGPIEMEFQVVVKREIGGDAKLSFHILAAEASLGGSGKGASERTQKVKFVLNPALVDMAGQRSKLEIARQREPQEAPSQSKQTLGRD